MYSDSLKFVLYFVVYFFCIPLRCLKICTNFEKTGWCYSYAVFTKGYKVFRNFQGEPIELRSGAKRYRQLLLSNLNLPQSSFRDTI